MAATIIQAKTEIGKDVLPAEAVLNVSFAIEAVEAAEKELLSTHIPVDKAVEAFRIACSCGCSPGIGVRCDETVCKRLTQFLSALGVNDKKEG